MSEHAIGFDKGYGEAAAPRDAEIKSLREQLAAANERAEKAEAEAAEWEQSFDLYHKAEVRAQQMWKEAHGETGEGTVWPDKAKMTIWLLDELKAVQSRIEKLEASHARLLERARALRAVIDAARVRGETNE